MTLRRVATIVAILVLLVPFAAAGIGTAGAQQAPGSSAERATESNESVAAIESVGTEHVATTDADTIYVWETADDGERIDSYAVETRVDTAGNDVGLCLRTGETEHCETLQNQSVASVSEQVSPGDRPLRVQLSLQAVTTGETLDARTVTLQPIAADGDRDRDGVSNAQEIEAGTDLTAVDSDEDGLSDRKELELGSDPTSLDTDGDGLLDGRERVLGTDPTLADTDSDGMSDAIEVVIGGDGSTAAADAIGLPEESAGEQGAATSAQGAIASSPDQSESPAGGSVDPFTPLWIAIYSLGFFAGVVLAAIVFRPGAVLRLPGSLRGMYGRLRSLTGESIVVTTTETQATADDSDPIEGCDSAEDVYEQSDLELIRDEELVDYFLTAEGGRMKQRRIVEITDWSKAKVSRLLSRMADEGAIVKVRLGRENLICHETARPV